MPAMMLPFAERSASGHQPGGWGVFGALIIEGALTRGPDGSGRFEGAGGVGGLLMLEEKPGSTTGVPVGAYYPLYDGNGKITHLLDAPGGVAAHFDYDAFGNVTAATGPAAAHNPWRFSTKPQDPVSGFHYYGYRHYDPVTGRWPSRDPIGEEGGVNVMGFVGNDPANLVDDRGLAPDDVSPPSFSYDAGKLEAKMKEISEKYRDPTKLPDHLDPKVHGYNKCPGGWRYLEAPQGKRVTDAHRFWEPEYYRGKVYDHYERIWIPVDTYVEPGRVIQPKEDTKLVGAERVWKGIKGSVDVTLKKNQWVKFSGTAQIDVAVDVKYRRWFCCVNEALKTTSFQPVYTEYLASKVGSFDVFWKNIKVIHGEVTYSIDTRVDVGIFRIDPFGGGSD